MVTDWSEIKGSSGEAPSRASARQPSARRINRRHTRLGPVYRKNKRGELCRGRSDLEWLADATVPRPPGVQSINR